MRTGDDKVATRKVAGMLNLPEGAEAGVVMRAFAEKFEALAPRLGEEEVALFDLVFLDMVRGSDTEARATLAACLAPIPNAPRQLVVDLAFDEAIIVAGPLLELSPRLDEDVLLTIATTKGPEHLAHLAIRASVSEELSEVLAQRGEEAAVLALVRNTGARFSEAGRAIVVERSFAAPVLFVAIDRRSDFGQAILAAYERRRSAPTQVTATPLARNLDSEVATLVGKGEIDAALAVIAIEAQTRHRMALRLYRQDTLDSFVIVARAANLSWGTVVGLLLNQLGVAASAYQINQCRKLYDDTTRAEAFKTVQTLTRTDATLYG